MANFRRRRPRGKSSPHYDKRAQKHPDAGWVWMSNWPAGWDLIHHTRPTRRADARATSAVFRGADPDETVWPLHKKPHQYYW